MHIRVFALGVTVMTAAIAIAALVGMPPATATGQNHRFDFGLIGDTRYTAEQRTKFVNLTEDINRYSLAFTVHDGDIKAGSNACTDEIFRETYDLFQKFADPLIYTPGDNEWTDCHRAGGDPLERLSMLRRTFYPTDESLGMRKLTLIRQHPNYPENARWYVGPVTFATVHIIGSNNNAGRTPESDAEFRARNAANLAWISHTFAAAKGVGSKAVMLFIQANMWDDIPASERTGFAGTIGLLQWEAMNFKGPIVLVHGDSHYFRIDKPLIGPHSQRRLENFTRVETFGTDDVHWIRVTMDPDDPQVFTFRQQIVEKNLVKHLP